MTDFKVVPDDLDRTSDQLADLAAGGTKAVDYVTKNVDLEGDAGLLLKPMMDQLIAACADLAGNYTRLGTVTGDSATELKKAAAMYRTLDQSRADAIDRTYPAKAGE